MPVALAEVNSTYGSEESSDDVHGLDVQVQGLPPSLDFLLVEVGPSRRGRFGPTSIIDTTGLHVRDSLSLAVPPTPPGTRPATALAGVLMDHAARLPPKVRLYAATASTGRMHIVLAFDPNLLPTGGLLMTDEKLLAATAFAERLLANGLDLAGAVIQRAAAKS